MIQNVEQNVKDELHQTKQSLNRESLLSVAFCLREQGLSVVPVKADKTPALKVWSPYQKRLMTEGERRRYFTTGTHGIAVICGQVSLGGLEVLDFDHKVPDKVACAYNAFSAIVKAERPELFEKLVINTTPNSGYHMPFICTQIATPGNKKLAEAEYQADGKTKTTTLIETKGEGGYFVVPPAPDYHTIQGDLSNIPTISADDRSYLMATARQFNQVKPKQKTKPSKSRTTYIETEGGLTPKQVIERYNEITNTPDLLLANGWTGLGTNSRRDYQFRRPGKTEGSISATYNPETKKLYNFSTSTDLPAIGRDEKGHAKGLSSFGVYALLHHNEDHTAAIRQLYIDNPKWSIPSNGYKPSRQEQLAGDDQLERMAGLNSETPEEIEVPADSQDVGRIERELVAETETARDDDSLGGVIIRLQADKIKQMRRAMHDTDRSILELMKWTPGTGKTYAAQAVAVEMAKRGQATIFAMQSNERAEQEATAMFERFGYRAAVIKGRNADNCANDESAEALGKGGHSVRQSLCLGCPVRQECVESGYLGQFDDYQSGRTKIAFMPVEMVELLKDNKGSATLSADVLVFDEDPSRIAMQTHTLTTKQLDRINPSTGQVGAVIDLLSKLILSVRNDGQALNDWSPLKDRIQSVLKRFKRKGGYHADLAMDTERVLKDVVGQINDNSRNLISTRPEYLEQVEPRWLADIASELKRTISADEPINTCLVVTKERLVFRHRRTIDPKAKMVVLDAYGRPEIYQQIFNKEVRVHQHQVKPDMTVYHIPMNTSRTRLKDDRLGRWTSDKWQQVTRNLTSLFEFEKMVVFVDGKEMVEKAETAVESLGLSDKVTDDYFHRGRGTNEYQDYDADVILGSAWPRSDAIVSETRALYRDDRYISDDVESSDKRRYKDSRLQQFKKSRQIDEIWQCIYRIRPATHSHPLGKKVVICTNFEIEGLTDQPEVIKMTNYAKSIEAEIRRSNLAHEIGEYLSKYSYMTLSSGLNSKLAKMLGGSHAGRGHLTFAINNNTEDNSLISECEITSHSKGFSASEKTIRKDLKKLVDDGSIEAHQETVVLDGKTYPTVVYGSMDAFKTDIEQARDIIDQRESRQGSNQYQSKNGKSASDGEPTEAKRPTREAAKKVGVNYDTANKALQVVDAIDQAEESGDQETAEELRRALEWDYLNSGEAVAFDGWSDMDTVGIAEKNAKVKRPTGPEFEPLPFDQDVDDRISNLCQRYKETPVRVSNDISQDLIDILSPLDLDYLNSGDAVVDDLYQVYELDRDAVDEDARRRAMVYRCIIEDSCRLSV